MSGSLLVSLGVAVLAPGVQPGISSGPFLVHITVTSHNQHGAAFLRKLAWINHRLLLTHFQFIRISLVIDNIADILLFF